MLTSALAEPLEPRQLMARVVPNPFLETSWGDAGVANVAFRADAGDKLVSTQLAATSSRETFVLGRTNKAVQVRKLTASGTIDTGWMPATKNLLYLADDTGSQDITIDNAGRVLVLAGPVLYRFSPTGEIDKKFGTEGHIALGVDGGNVAIDAANSIYVSGIAFVGSATSDTGRAKRLLVKKFTAGGKVDTTFAISGRLIAPLPRGLPATTTVNMLKSGSEVLRTFPRVAPPSQPMGEQIRILPGSDAQSTADDRIVVASSLLLTDSTQPAGTQTQSVEAVRFNADGELDRTYARQGIAYLAGTPSTAAGHKAFVDYTLASVLPNGRVSTCEREVSRLFTYTTEPGINLTVNGAVDEDQIHHYAIYHAAATFDGGYIGIEPFVGVSRFTASDDPNIAFLNGSHLLRHFGDIELATIREPSNLLASTISGPGVATVSLFKPKIDALIAS
ncbi:MAG: hypothetical protein JWM57_3573 [Phycisphaerales bacterium]|nr:hypothetical protein [Phycisphaerales bacterium]